jgi:small-conductance mechanosensitive channel
MRLLPILIVLAVLLSAGINPGFAQTAEGTVETPALQLERWEAEAALVERMLKEGTLDSAGIEGMRATLEAQREAIPRVVAEAETGLAPLRKQLEALGPVPEDPHGEAAEITAERARLSKRISLVEVGLKRASQADARADALLSQLAEQRRRLFTEEMLTRGPSVFEAGAVERALASIGSVSSATLAETVERAQGSTLDTRFFIRLPLALLLIGAALFLLLRVKRAALRHLMPGAAEGIERRRGILTGLGVTLVRLLIPTAALAMTVFAIWSSQLVGPRGEIMLGGLTRAMMAVVAAYALGGAFYSPHFPDYRLSQLPEDAAAAASRWLMALAAVVGLDLLFVVQGHRLGHTIEGLEFINTLLVICGGVALWGFAGYLVPPGGDIEAGPADEDAEARSAADEMAEPTIGPALVTVARLVARASAVVSPVLALMGYFAASRFLFYPVVLSGAVIGVCVLLFWWVQDIVDRLAHRESAGEAASSRVRLIPVIVGFLLTGAAAPVLALIWGADVTDLSAAWRAISVGFRIGEVTIAPLDFLSFLLIFSIGYVLTRILQGVLSRSVLPVTGLDAGGRAAVRAGVGYVGITLAALVAISATGLDLSNLAIVAGALSVGIGFGLQNIVNNFVSGIILLIERPIKAGDWVELGSGMGYVKRINVRSTEIETFDRASLIVPNSELISGPVTNWTHTNLNGRIIVPVGAAYGADPRQVETILTEIAKAHPMLLRRPAPYVLFRRFGADALEFEIRAVLRDVNWILNVTSDINFEISRRFTEAGIEIPFAQRDLHLRNAGELGRAIGDAVNGRAGEAPEVKKRKPSPKKPRRPGPSEAAGTEPDGDT